MKQRTRLVSIVLASILCVASVCSARGAEKAGETAILEGETTDAADEAAAGAEAYETEGTGEGWGSVVPEVTGEARSEAAEPANTVWDGPEAYDMAPAIEEPAPAENTEPKPMFQGSVSGDSKVTWTKNTMPVPKDTTIVRQVSKAYLTTTSDGYMRVLYDGESVVIEYFNDNFQMTKQGRLSMELDRWGGFYEGEDAYYIAEGQQNDDTDGTEVVRIIKYDFDWNRIGAGCVLAEKGWEYEIRTPYFGSGANMKEINGKLYLVTSREGYVDPNYGMGHQGMMLIRMDEETFETEVAYGDFLHSFTQQVDNIGKDLIICERSDGYRCTMLSRFDTDRTGTDHYNAFSSGDRFPVFGYGGKHTSAWGIDCYASLDDMVLSSENILCLGTSIDQSQYDHVTDDTAYNIYLTVTPKSDQDSEHTAVRWLTDYTGDGKSFYGVNITKINDDRFLVAWEEFRNEDEKAELTDYRDALSDGVLHYLFVDGSGSKVSKEFRAPAVISDCHPVLKDSKVVFYTCNGVCLDFYTIDAQTGKFGKSVTRIAGDNITWDYDNGVLSFKGKGNLKITDDLLGASRPSLTDDPYRWHDPLQANYYWEDIIENVTEIKIGKNITSISDNTFEYFKKLLKVTLPNELKKIGDGTFYCCSTFKIYAGCGSYGVKYAKEKGIYCVVSHNWNTEITKASTKKNGKIVKTCSSCGESAPEKVIYYPKTIKLTNTPITYNGKVQRPEVVIIGSNGKAVSADNYTLTYTGGCKEIGSYSVKADFKGNYSGTLTKNFRIILGKTGRGDMFNLANNVKVTWKAVPGAKYYKVYREGVTDPSESLAEPVVVTTGLIGWDKLPGLTNGHAYRYRIVASRTGKDDDSKDSPLSYSKLMYRLKTVVIRSVKNTASGEVTVRYDKTSSGDSYVLQWADNEDMVDAKTKVVLGADNTSYTISGLEKGKTYYISIRVRKKVDGIDYYTTFGVPKKVTISK